MNMRWPLLVALVAWPMPSMGQDMPPRSFDDGTSSSSAGQADDSSRSSSDDRVMDARPAEQEIQVGKRLTQRLNGRLDTRITPQRLSQARDATLGRDDQDIASRYAKSRDGLTETAAPDE